MIFGIFHSLPLWVTYLLIVLLILFSVRAGIAYARWRLKRVKNEDVGSINTLVGATLGLLAFILAFTFGLSSSRFDARKQFLLDEVNSIETSWLRAGLMESPFREKFKEEILDYVEVRVWLAENSGEVKSALEKSEQIQNNIWTQITEMNDQDVGKQPINALFINSVNDMFDNQTNRVSKGTIDHIPTLIWVALFALIVISMFQVGYLLGKTEASNWVLIIALSLSFSAIVMLIVDLDSLNGLISVDNQILFDMYERIKA